MDTGRVRLTPALLGLEWARVQIPTPYGMIELRLQEGKTPELTVPEEIAWEMQ